MNRTEQKHRRAMLALLNDARGSAKLAVRNAQTALQFALQRPGADWSETERQHMRAAAGHLRLLAEAIVERDGAS